MSSYSTWLKSALEDAKVKVDDDKWFIPGRKVNQIITEDAVRNALQTTYYSTTNVDALVRKICRPDVAKSRNEPVSFHARDRDTSCRRIFAVLVLIGKATPDIILPIADKLCDLDLPLQLAGEPVSLVSFRDVTYRPIAEKHLDCFEGPNWSVEKKQKFYHVQSSLISMILSKQGVGIPQSIRLFYNAVLPWKKPRQNRLASNGDVLKTSIYDGHHQFSDSEQGKPYVAAIKAIKSPGDLYEVGDGGWEVLADGSNEHIVEFLLVILLEADGRYHFLFRWPLGILRDIWGMTLAKAAHSCTPAATRPKDVKCWVFEQCLGLAEAMAQIHQFPYAHGDIRPENVFWYQQTTGSGNAPSLGTLKILSFGDTKLVDNSQESRRAARGDIWALGCVYLEFMAWYILGPDEVDTAVTSEGNDASDKRDFFASLSRMQAINMPADGLTPSIEANKAALHTSLSAGERCDPAVLAFIDFVLLCMLEPDASFRAGCQRVLEEVQGFNAKVKEDS